MVNLAKAKGLDAQRTAQLQAATRPGDPDVTLHDWPGLHVEVKRDERMSVDAMVRQARDETPLGARPIVAYRRNGQEWAAVVPLSLFFDLLASVLNLTRESRP